MKSGRRSNLERSPRPDKPGLAPSPLLLPLKGDTGAYGPVHEAKASYYTGVAWDDRWLSFPGIQLLKCKNLRPGFSRPSFGRLKQNSRLGLRPTLPPAGAFLAILSRGRSSIHLIA